MVAAARPIAMIRSLWVYARPVPALEARMFRWLRAAVVVAAVLGAQGARAETTEPDAIEVFTRADVRATPFGAFNVK